jgi:hypothetical protein
MPNKRWPRFSCLLCALCTLFAVCGPGCSRGFKNAPVNAPKARETLRTALESWKKGDKDDALQSAAPPIYVIDMDWRAGARLRDYRIVNDGEEKDAHLFCPVKLTLQYAGGKEVTTEVTFVIATAPNLAVSRKVF